MPPFTRTVTSVFTQLSEHYGRPAATHPSGRPLDVLVETILSQHTSDRNSHRAFLSLRRAFPRWADICSAQVQDIEAAIRCGGLAKQKALRIQAVLRLIREREGKLSLARLNRLTDEEAYAYLAGLPGVGGKTACCVLLFSLGRTVMPVDTHIHRIVKRLGWIDERATPAAARRVLEQRLLPGQLYWKHVLLIAHGRQTCIAIRPRCGECPVRAYCAHARLRRRHLRSDQTSGTGAVQSGRTTRPAKRAE
jgi:endonuclease III